MQKLIKLNRFTTLPVLLDFLEKQKLVLLDPCNWDDKNDTEFITEYKRKAKLDKMFALCFTHASETIHHWKTFANGASGCCIEFSPDKLIAVLNHVKGLRHGPVRYKTLKEAKSLFNLKDFPFIKRTPYKFEREYRVIWEGKSEATYMEIAVPIQTVRKITFSQQMPESVYESVKAVLIKNYPFLKNRINRSTIYRNETWINYAKK